MALSMDARKTGSALLLALCFAALACGSIPQAATRSTDSVADLVRLAETVVEVDVVKQTESDKSEPIPYSMTTLKIKKSYKGALVAGQLIEVKCFGGRRGAFEVFASGQARFESNMRAVVALSRDSEAPHVFRVLGGDIGQIVLAPDDSGRIMARRSSGKFSYYAADKESLTGYKQIETAAVPAETMDALLNTLVDTGRPVLENGSALPVVPASKTALASTPNTPERHTSLLSRLLIVLALTTLALFAFRKVR